MIHEIPISSIFMLKRERQDMGDMEFLRYSIEQFGLLEPIILEPRPEGKFCLLAGARRLECYKKLGKETVPAILIEDLDELRRKELEFEENVRHKPLTVIEEAKSIAAIHALKKEQFARNFPEKFGRSWGQKDTAETLEISTGKVSESLAIDEYLKYHPDVDPKINRTDLLKLIRHTAKDYVVPDITLYQQRMKEFFIYDHNAESLGRLKSLSVSSIITDITGHAPATILTPLVAKVAYNAHCWFFCSITEIPTLQAWLKEIKWNYLPEPHVWHIKGEDKMQFILWASPAQGSPPKGCNQHLSLRRDATSTHVLEKPYALYSLLLTTGVERGSLVIDPNSFGPTLARVAIDSMRNSLCVCREKELWEKGILNVEAK